MSCVVPQERIRRMTDRIPDDFSGRFSGATVQQLIDALNAQAGVSGWGSTRSQYLSALRDAFLATGLDCSGFIDQAGMQVVTVTLEGEKIIPVLRPAEAAPSVPPPEGADRQRLIDGLVFEAHRPDLSDRARALGAEFAKIVTSLQEAELEGVLLEFDHELLTDEGDSASAQNRDAAVEAYVSNQTGEQSVWQVVSLESRAGDRAHAAIILRGDYPCDCEVVGVFLDETQALAALGARGYTSIEHYRSQRRTD